MNLRFHNPQRATKQLRNVVVLLALVTILNPGPSRKECPAVSTWNLDRPRRARAEDVAEVRLDIPVEAHVGTPEDYLGRLQYAARRAAQGDGEEEYLANVFEWAIDTRNLECAWEFCRHNGGGAPGIDGLTYSHIPRKNLWRYLDNLHDALKDGSYNPALPLEKHIPKGAGRGTRLLHLPVVNDRAIGRAILQAIDPYVDPTLDDKAYGWRRRRSSLHALARAAAIAEAEDRWMWVSQDIRDAFANVPRNRLRDILSLRLPNERLVDFIMRLADYRSPRGIPMGQPLCPMLMSLYRDHFLDKPWCRDYPEIPLLSAGDDLLVLCRDQEEAQQAATTLQNLLQPAGLPPKYSLEESIHDLDAGETMAWLGFGLEKWGGDLQVRIPETRWENLEENLSRLQEETDAPLRARASIQQWVCHLGPTLPHENAEEVIARVVSRCQQYAFEEVPTQGELLGEWEKGYAQWEAVLATQRVRQRGSASGSAPRHSISCETRQRAGGVNGIPPVSAGSAEQIMLFTDGSCDRHTRVGGWAYIIESGGRSLECSNGCVDTTNNRMELLAVVSGLQRLEAPGWVCVVTDSTYVADGATRHLDRWRNQEWRCGPPHALRPLQHDDLWQELYRLIAAHDEVVFQWIPGHSGHPQNERCDQLARAAVERHD